MRSFLIDVVGLTWEQAELLRDNVRGDNPMPIVEKTMVWEAEALTMLFQPVIARSDGHREP